VTGIVWPHRCCTTCYSCHHSHCCHQLLLLVVIVVVLSSGSSSCCCWQSSSLSSLHAAAAAVIIIIVVACSCCCCCCCHCHGLQLLQKNNSRFPLISIAFQVSGNPETLKHETNQNYSLKLGTKPTTYTVPTFFFLVISTSVLIKKTATL
jgi:hypothetical protein